MYQDNCFDIRLVDDACLDGTSNDGQVSSGVTYFVMDAGTKTFSTIYSNRNRTAKTNAVTRSQFATDGAIKFFGPNSSYDIFVAHSDGSTAFYSGVTPQTHTRRLNRSQNSKCLVVPFGVSDNVETDTTIDFPLGALVYDARLLVTTADATETLSVGLLSTESGGDADGFLAGISVAATGWVAPAASTVGGSETYLSAVTYGALLGEFLAGSNSAGDVGTFLRFHKQITVAKSVSYTGSSGSDTAAGFIFLPFLQMY